MPLAVLASIYLMLQKRHHAKALDRLQEAQASGLTEPATLHPVIDPSVCIGCGTCVSACPEGRILGLINRKAVLVSPASCIGHGACNDACPTGAISLVFGTETRGVEIPQLDSDFETTVPGVFIAGELGGMGLIKNAIAQGKQAVDAISWRLRKTSGSALDLVIVGAGPAGLSAALAARQKGLQFAVLEQDSVGGTVSHYPRGKVVMTQPAELPLVGKFQFREASKETLMEFWESVADNVRSEIHTGCRVERIEKSADLFTITTPQETFHSRFVLLAMGRRGTPRKLGVTGEDLPKVVYRLIDPEQYSNRHVLVVGGGDSALEAALAVAGQPGTTTSLSYRSGAFSRAKTKNRSAVETAVAAGKINLFMNSNVTRIEASEVIIDSGDRQDTLPNDDIIVCAGGVLATGFLRSIGIHVEEKFGTV
ncbi:MAG: FAD-dependent oxidoreductase [Gammaproteobacteria bacterium]